jgi:hypothetical protein
MRIVVAVHGWPFCATTAMSLTCSNIIIASLIYHPLPLENDLVVASERPAGTCSVGAETSWPWQLDKACCELSVPVELRLWSGTRPWTQLTTREAIGPQWCVLVFKE